MYTSSYATSNTKLGLSPTRFERLESGSLPAPWLTQFNISFSSQVKLSTTSLSFYSWHELFYRSICPGKRPCITRLCMLRRIDLNVSGLDNPNQWWRAPWTSNLMILLFATMCLTFLFMVMSTGTLQDYEPESKFFIASLAIPLSCISLFHLHCLHGQLPPRPIYFVPEYTYLYIGGLICEPPFI